MNESVIVNAAPTKRFFVSMLTRDIELKDSILDLLDNCVDGIERQTNGTDQKNKPYNGFWAKITANQSKFEIIDNCGGISHQLLVDSAFRLGRANIDTDSGVHTVGMYGIGMKRAIFKMGKQCRVVSKPKKDNTSYMVEISPIWLESDEWTLPITSGNYDLEDYGTKITVENLYESIAHQLNEEKSNFIEELRSEISQFYAIIIEKGFSVFLNDEKIQGVSLSLLTTQDTNSTSIRPYVFQGKISDVDVLLSVGFHRQLATEKELDDEAQEPRKSDYAGWTIICNDRVVLYCDKNPVTGWGRGTVPKYHTQFISISGWVVFRSSKLMNLPLNTTKRGLDTSSNVYLTVLDYMMEGLKIFTDFTNKWKSREIETNSSFKETKKIGPKEILDSVKGSEYSTVRKIEGARKYSPSLPLPESKNPLKRIVYTKHEEDISRLGMALFEDAKAKPSDVGERCFEIALNKINNEG